MNYTVDFAKYKAPRIHQIVQDRLLKGNLIKKPLWFDVVNMFPPIHRPVNIVHHDSSRFSSILAKTAYSEEAISKHPLFNSEKTIDKQRFKDVEKYCLQMPSRKWSFIRRKKGQSYWNKAVMDASRLYAFPEDIVYPEDRLRERFYNDHPLERSRPRIFKEFENQQSQDTREEPAIRDGEDVVRYQYELMTRKKDALTEDEAYKVACGKFYETRIREEHEIQKLQLQAKALGADIGQTDAATAPEEHSHSVNIENDNLDIRGSLGVEKKTQREQLIALEKWIELEQIAVEEACEIKNKEAEERRERELARQKISSL